jgi:hypothetical protein
MECLGDKNEESLSESSNSDSEFDDSEPENVIKMSIDNLVMGRLENQKNILLLIDSGSSRSLAKRIRALDGMVTTGGCGFVKIRGHVKI